MSLLRDYAGPLPSHVISLIVAASRRLRFDRVTPLESVETLESNHLVPGQYVTNSEETSEETNCRFGGGFWRRDEAGALSSAVTALRPETPLLNRP